MKENRKPAVTGTQSTEPLSPKLRSGCRGSSGSREGLTRMRGIRSGSTGHLSRLRPSFTLTSLNIVARVAKCLVTRRLGPSLGELTRMFRQTLRIKAQRRNCSAQTGMPGAMLSSAGPAAGGERMGQVGSPKWARGLRPDLATRCQRNED